MNERKVSKETNIHKSNNGNEVAENHYSQLLEETQRIE